VWFPKAEHNIGTLWRSATIFQADFIFTIGPRYRRQVSDTLATWRHIPLYTYVNYADFYAHLPYDCRLVCVELAPGAFDLRTFVHPERAIYLLGAEDNGLPSDVLRGQIVIQIPAPCEHNSLNVATAGSIILWDRWCKSAVRGG